MMKSPSKGFVLPLREPLLVLPCSGSFYLKRLIMSKIHPAVTKLYELIDSKYFTMPRLEEVTNTSKHMLVSWRRGTAEPRVEDLSRCLKYFDHQLVAKNIGNFPHQTPMKPYGIRAEINAQDRIVKNLFEYLHLNHWNLKEFSERTNFSYNKLQHWMRGDRSPSIVDVSKLLKFCGKNVIVQRIHYERKPEPEEINLPPVHRPLEKENNIIECESEQDMLYVMKQFKDEGFGTCYKYQDNKYLVFKTARYY